MDADRLDEIERLAKEAATAGARGDRFPATDVLALIEELRALQSLRAELIANGWREVVEKCERRIARRKKRAACRAATAASTRRARGGE